MLLCALAWLPLLTRGCHSADGGLAAQPVRGDRHLRFLSLKANAAEFWRELARLEKWALIPFLFNKGDIRGKSRDVGMVRLREAQGQSVCEGETAY